jgi:hypothetical protein
LNNGRTCPVLIPHIQNCTIPPPIRDISGADISGNITTTVNSTDKFMIFKRETSTFTVRSEGVICDILMIGGGGAGGNHGGGGAGACIVAIGHTIPSGVYNVTVGSGAVYGNGILNGGDSSISVGGTTLYLAKGGGCGGYWVPNGNPGGCGGGGNTGWMNTIGGNDVSTNIVNGEPNIGRTIQPTYVVLGNKGGDQLDHTSNDSAYTGAGGGGIGAAAPNHAFGDVLPGPGGAGLNEARINGITYNFKSYFANNNIFGHNNNGYIGGGGAGSASFISTQADGGVGGGGKGAANIHETNIIRATPGATNTGSGGGGDGGGGGYVKLRIGNSDGGSGIVIIRYRS